MNISETAQRIMDALQSKDLNIISDYLNDNMQMRGGAITMHKKGILALFKAYFEAFPDWSFNFTDAHEVDGVFEVRAQVTGTHTRTLDFSPLGTITIIPPTRQRLQMPPIVYAFKLEGDKVVEMQSHQFKAISSMGLFSQVAN